MPEPIYIQLNTQFSFDRAADVRRVEMDQRPARVKEDRFDVIEVLYIVARNCGLFS